jgi:hypothetical protein
VQTHSEEVFVRIGLELRFQKSEAFFFFRPRLVCKVNNVSYYLTACRQELDHQEAILKLQTPAKKRKDMKKIRIITAALILFLYSTALVHAQGQESSGTS